MHTITLSEREFIHIVDRLTYPTSRRDILAAVRVAGRGNGAVVIAEKLPPGVFKDADAVKNAVLHL